MKKFDYSWLIVILASFYLAFETAKDWKSAPGLLVITGIFIVIGIAGIYKFLKK